MKALLLVAALVATAVPAFAADMPDVCTDVVGARGDCDGMACVSSSLVPWASGCVEYLDCSRIVLWEPCTCPPMSAPKLRATLP